MAPHPFSPARLCGALLAAAVLSAPAGAQQRKYPPAHTVDQTDTYHGTLVRDPYRWLEDPDAPDTRAWIAAENALTSAYLDSMPRRAAIRERLTKLWDYPKYSTPFSEGPHTYWFENTGLQNQSVLYVRDGRNGRPRAILDPNALSADGTVALGALAPSPDGHWLAYGVQASGSDWQEFRVRDLQSGEDTPDTLKWIKFSGLAWTHDNRGFFYSRYDAPAAGTALTTVVKFQKLCYHKLGTPQSDDPVIYERSDGPDWMFDARATDDGEYIVVTVTQGADERTRVYVIDLGDPGRPVVDHPVVKLLDAYDATYAFIDNIGLEFYFRTDRDAPRGRVFEVRLDAMRLDERRNVIAETPDALEDVAMVGDHLVATYLHDAHSEVRFYGLHGGGPVGGLTLPGLGTVSGITGHQRDQTFPYSFTSFLSPPTVFEYDFGRKRSEVFREAPIAFDASAYETTQVFATSKDGTKVPVFITAKKGLVRDGSHPALLYAYGGFNISLTPSFSPATLVWLEMGGVYAQANLRGGGEYGRAWHEAGTLSRKQNVFDDFIAAAEFLEREGYTSKAKLAVQGASNGGLLIGAVMTQRPDLMAVALPEVGVMDMLRFQKFTIGWAWTSDYGSSDDSLQFQALYQYSPYHNIKPGTIYPATLISTADHDDRVVPGHSFKFAARLQAAQAGAAPVLIRIDTKSGHGGGKPTSKQIEEWADELGFVAKNVGMENRE